MMLLAAAVGSGPVTVKTALVQPKVLSGMEIQIQNDRITLLPGVCRVGDKTAKVAKSVTFTIAPAESIAVTDEEYQLSSEPTERWGKGTHLKQCLHGTAIPGALLVGSVVVKLPDGSVAKEGTDYHLDTRWAGLSRIESGRIQKETKVRISYRVGLMRLDSLAVNSDGKVELIAGKADVTTPQPPEIAKDTLRIANVFMPPGAASVAAWQVFVIGDGFPETDENLMALRQALVSKTLNKLRRGQPVKIVAWGDSVTAGGDVSSPAKAFPALFATRLGERFRGSKITLVNAGIGATTSAMRLPNLQKDVTSHQPDLVLIEFVNDMGVPEATVRQNMDSAFEQIRAVGGEIILITPHFTMQEMMKLDLPRGKESRPTVSLLRQIAEEKSVGLADVSRRWEHLEKEGIPYITLLKNGINHPDDRGHELFVRELLTFFPPESIATP
jgi:lysophospholipase L1-like esterase